MISRRQLLSRAIAAPIAAAVGVGKPVSVAPCVTVFPVVPSFFTSQVIQCAFATGQPTVDPDQAKDPSLELVWERVLTHPEGGRIHQRLYVPKAWGVPRLPEDFLDGKGFVFSEADLARSKAIEGGAV